MATQKDSTNSLRPIQLILDDANYLHWAQQMRCFLQGRRLWGYVSGSIKAPSCTDAAFEDKEADWVAENSKIISWFSNTSLPKINQLFGPFDTAKEVWDYLAATNTVSDLASQYQIDLDLHRTLSHGLHYPSTSSLQHTAYSAADWGHDLIDHRSTTGHSLISWLSKKQFIVSHSSTESEYRAFANTTAELVWLRWLLGDVGVPFDSATPIHCDSQSASQITQNDVFYERMKHIKIDRHVTRTHLICGILELIPVSCSDQLADVFTKSFSVKNFLHLVSKLNLFSPSLLAHQLRDSSAPTTTAPDRLVSLTVASLSSSVFASKESCSSSTPASSCISSASLSSRFRKT
ncbi:hypothetical protein RJ639_012523 [Escallonia herrerae]|uniref:Retrotransposon Copia-like N-terminal domain-containing protein n=1 Tax=Escallonia herrerae TaxID=1293975 RepID=A0AA88VMP2_9ASTE|nr:hypothetical protein RJ639_012523 [Escallonia herrerae]